MFLGTMTDTSQLIGSANKQAFKQFLTGQNKASFVVPGERDSSCDENVNRVPSRPLSTTSMELHGNPCTLCE